MSDEEDFARLLEAYLEPERERNPALARVRIKHVRDNPAYGAQHMWERHQVSEQEVEEVILEMPPTVECKRDPDHPDRLLFLGATRKRRQLLVVCDVEGEGETKILVPITGFEADEKEWRKK